MSPFARSRTATFPAPFRDRLAPPHERTFGSGRRDLRANLLTLQFASTRSPRRATPSNFLGISLTLSVIGKRLPAPAPPHGNAPAYCSIRDSEEAFNGTEQRPVPITGAIGLFVFRNVPLESLRQR